VTTDTPNRVPGFAWINLSAWLLFAIAWGVGPFADMPWHAFVAFQLPYIFIGYVMSLLLAVVYDRVGVGPASLPRSLGIIVPFAYAAGILWMAAFSNYRVLVGPIVHSMLIGTTSDISVRPSLIISRAIGTALPLFGWSLLRLALQYSAALRQEREQSLRAAAAARDARLRMLAYQLNPHFLFNTLNSIRALINEDQRRARDMVTALSDYLRYALVDRPLHVALLDEEVTAVRGYLAIEKVRFEERLDVRLDIDPVATHCEVPAFLLNPLVENAVKHGAADATDAPLKVRVEARIVSDRLRLIVENSGVWDGARTAGHETDDSFPGGVGLANVRARLAALHPGDHRIDIESADGLVRVVVDLPVRLCNEVTT
jgi:two-component system LytT family sensor kinase